ncbi:hypothetical protein EGR_10841 [Echinococcus granulosus]|uniref:Uncharacterized protein n=1 Tax=Echinococcus granulosus TaxID=6210 RepID=W6TZP5_ECHGR|nr:hypothetical protein EGR_10841 [Echinococcus granulosus]EUB54300.1 hypothetical protein EGR_10841 [Echinococcus granulosus]
MRGAEFYQIFSGLDDGISSFSIHTAASHSANLIPYLTDSKSLLHHPTFMAVMCKAD